MAILMPPLSSLRAFEAAVRLESFSRAADEIHVTHGAVSHQVRGLEDFIGVRLFHREGRGVIPTPDGRALAHTIRDSLSAIAEATAAIRRRKQSRRLSIATLPSFGSRWLMPRIVRFMAEHPDWTINIDSSPALTDFARDDVDVVIRFGKGGWHGMHCELLMHDDYVLVASPALVKGRRPRQPARIVDFPLLRSDAEPWIAWCAAAGIDIPVPERGVGYEDMGIMLQGAIDGQGLMLARRSIAATEIEKGALVQLFDIATPSPQSYWIIRPEDRPPTERATAFRDWLHAEAAAGGPGLSRDAADGVTAGSRRPGRAPRRGSTARAGRASPQAPRAR